MGTKGKPSPRRGQRQIRLCKFGCGRQVAESWGDGRFRAYKRTCGICRSPRSHLQSEKDKISKAVRGMNHPGAKPLGSRRQHQAGTRTYWKIKVNESGRWPFEHRHLMEQFLGRPLQEDEIVHHINGDGLDNRPENLILMKRSKHAQNIALQNMNNKVGLFDVNAHRCPICGRLHSAIKMLE